MNQDVLDLIEYLKAQKIKSRDDDTFPGVIITEAAASNAINMLEDLLQECIDSRDYIKKVIQERDAIADKIDDAGDILADIREIITG